jgi:hypothetical protein
MQSMYAYMCPVMQRDFGASRCSVCGMVYTKGHQEDEKLHKAYHQGAVQGFKFQVSSRLDVICKPHDAQASQQQHNVQNSQQ